MLDQHTFSNMQSYIHKMEEVLTGRQDATNPAELVASRTFNVAGAALGSKPRWQRIAPKLLTLEDIFTLIHQNLLVIESVYAKTDLPCHH